MLCEGDGHLCHLRHLCRPCNHDTEGRGIRNSHMGKLHGKGNVKPMDVLSSGEFLTEHIYK